MKEKVTRNDVAKLANVSPPVVSYVLNNSNYVAPKTRAAVLKAIKELNYVPNQLAKGLRSSRTSHFIFVCDNAQSELFELLESNLFEKGYFVTLSYSKNDESFINMLVSHQYEGIFIVSNRYSSEELNDIASHNIPIILYETRAYENLDERIVTIVPDYYDAVYRSVNFLAEKGHERICFVPPVKYQSTGILGKDYRTKAYLDAMKFNNLEVDESWISKDTKNYESTLKEVEDLMFLSEEQKRPTAIIAGNDYLATRIMHRLKTGGLSCPQDVSIVGCENSQISIMTSPPLTTIDVNHQKLSEIYAESMLSMVNGEEVKPMMLDVTLINRDSA